MAGNNAWLHYCKGICVINGSGPVSGTVNAASLASFELTAVLPALIFPSLAPNFVI